MDEDANVLNEEEIKAAIREVFKRCQTDWEFRQLCLGDPGAAIEEVSGKSLPKGFVLQFKEAD